MFKRIIKSNNIYKPSILLVIIMALCFLFGGGIYIYKSLVVSTKDNIAIIDFLNNDLLDQQNIGTPVNIKIPSINVDAAIESVILTASGNMDVPKKPTNVGWYELGPRPGEVGSAVLAGHVDWLGGATAVFTDLDKLQLGDKILVQDNEGKIITFIVRKSQTFDAMANRQDVFTSNDGKAHLNLITCEGVWSKKAQSYSQRLVVFTDQE